MRTAILIAGWTWVVVALVQFTDVTDEMDWVFGLFFSGLLLGGAWIVALFQFPACRLVRGSNQKPKYDREPDGRIRDCD